MSRPEGRLGRLETGLTPSQAFLLWLQEVQGFDSLVAYARWVVEQPDGSYPLVRMPRQVAEAVRQAMKGKSRNEFSRQIARAQKEVVFLFYLWKIPNLELLAAAEELRLRLHLLVEQHRLLSLAQQVEREVGRRRKRPLAFCYPTDVASLDEKAVEWRESARDCFLSVFTSAAAARLLSRHYFSGQEFLFSQTAGILANAEGAVQCLTELFNLGPRAKDDIGLVLDEIQEEARPQARALARYWVDMAKAEALEKAGEEGAAEELVRSHLARPLLAQEISSTQEEGQAL